MRTITDPANYFGMMRKIFIIVPQGFRFESFISSLLEDV
jgi:hypothetical protein